MKLLPLLALVVLPAAVVVADIEFNGVLVTGNTTTVSLLDLTTGKAEWVRVGGNFTGYTVTSLAKDAKLDDVVVLTKAGTGLTTRLTLKNSTIVEAAPVTTNPVNIAQQEEIAKQSKLGRAQYQAGDLAAAEKTYQAILSLNASSKEAQYYLKTIAAHKATVAKPTQ